MSTSQREQNPDVNSYQPEGSPAESPGSTDKGNNTGDIERRDQSDVIPVPPDSEPNAPVEEPPRSGDAPVGDVDDSPKKIA